MCWPVSRTIGRIVVRSSSSYAAVSPAGPAPMITAVPVNRWLADKGRVPILAMSGGYHTAPLLMTEPLMIALTILSFVWAGYEIAQRRSFLESAGFELWCASFTIGA